MSRVPLTDLVGPELHSLDDEDEVEPVEEILLPLIPPPLPLVTAFFLLFSLCTPLDTGGPDGPLRQRSQV